MERNELLVIIAVAAAIVIFVALMFSDCSASEDGHPALRNSAYPSSAAPAVAPAAPAAQSDNSWLWFMLGQNASRAASAPSEVHHYHPAPSLPATRPVAAPAIRPAPAIRTPSSPPRISTPVRSVSPVRISSGSRVSFSRGR